MRNKLNKLSLILLSFSIVGCSSASNMFSSSDETPPLEGERISVLALQKALEVETPLSQEQGLTIPNSWRNEFWPQVGGYPNHSMQHLSLPASPLSLAWKADIGKGSSKHLPLTAQPIIVGGRIFTLDTDTTLTAFDSQNGKKIWETDVINPNEEDPVISGGMAFAGGYIYLTNGYSEVLAIAPKDGSIHWRKKLPAPARAAPTVMNDRIFISTLDNRLLALDAKDGSQLWDYKGLLETAGLLGAASPAVNRDIVVPAFSSGEIVALRVENGSVAWSDNLSNLRRYGGLAGLADIEGLPVIDKGIVIAISYSGRLVAIDERSGTRIWQREIAGAQTPWLAGNNIFVLSNENQLIALSRDNGAIHWITDLPRYEDPSDKKGAITWTGPVLAGGRLILSGTEGRIIEVSPEKGDIKTQWSVDDTIIIPPIVAGGALFLLSEDGQLMAYK